ncbi:MAG: RNA polymerase sigma-54 factor [Acidobacteria bacterium]|nr:MAG: RNA polymerase sigma-54 factor [Acidobacteriota bacterium]
MGGTQPRIGLNLRVAQKQILTPGLVQMVSVLALNKLELREMISQEMISNPVLEELEEVLSLEEVHQKIEAEKPVDGALDTRDGDKQDSFEQIDFGSFFDNYLDPGFKSPATEDIEKPSFENFLAQPSSLADHLELQLRLSTCSEAVRAAAFSIIGNLNEDGYLTATLEEMVQTGEHKLEDVEQALALVQQFDPPGVASRDVRECLVIQLRTLAPENTLARQIVSDFLKQLQNKQYREIARALDRPVQSVERAVEIIRKLDPRPGQRYNNNQARLIEPDVAIVKTGNDYQVTVNEDGLPQLRLSHRYRRMLEESGTSRDVRNYVKERFISAIQLIKNIEQRKQTIIKVCEVIIRRQRDFLDKGIDHLRPMMIKEVAEEVGVHPSTVSRAVANKYAYTPQGVYELRYFFSEAVQGPSGGGTSLINLKRLVKKMIEEEDPIKPWTDEQVTARLREQGINVTRRTVAKYREDMRIPSTHQRRVKA